MINRERGFSLIEIIIATAITAMIVSSVYFSFSNILNTRSRIKARAERIRQVYFTLDIMKRDLQNAYLTMNKGVPEQTHITLFEGTEDDPVSHVTFSSLNHTSMKADIKECDQTEIEYYGETNDDGENVLMRRESFWVDAFPDKGGNVFPLLTGFKSIKVEYWDKEDQEWLGEWKSESVEKADTLPPKIKITMEVRDEDENRKAFRVETVIKLSMLRPITL